MASIRKANGRGGTTSAPRRLTARSVIASTLLGVAPPALPTRSLVATAELLGVAPGTARVALSRMVAAGELAATDDGYRLISADLLARQARQVHSRAADTRPWDGRWRLYVVVSDEPRAASERSELRASLQRLRFSELREGTWSRPDNLPPDRDPHAAQVVAAQCTAMDAHPDHPSALVDRLWDLSTWGEQARLLHRRLDRVGGPLDRLDPDALAEGFVLSADVLRHFQADPLLPPPLLPPTWPGADLRDRYEHFDHAFRATLTTWLRTHRAP